MVSTVYTTEQASAGRNSNRTALTNSQNMPELSDCSGSIPTTLSITNTESTMEANSAALILPDPPTHEPGGKSKNKGKGKGVKNKLIGMFASRK